MAVISNLENIVSRLWECSNGILSEDEIKWIVSGNTSAATYMKNLSEVLAGIGLLVASDGRKPPGLDKAGTFSDPEDLSTLMFFLADCLSHAQALAHVGEQAHLKLRDFETLGQPTGE